MTSLLLWFQAGNVVNFAEFTFALFSILSYSVRRKREGKREEEGGEKSRIIFDKDRGNPKEKISLVKRFKSQLAE